MRADAREQILERLANGESLTAICAGDDMPNRSTVQRWQDADPEWDAAVTRARETGYHAMAELALLEATAKTVDPSQGRLAFDARRWYLGKLSNAFSDKQKHELTGKDGGAIETANKVDVTGLSEAALREIAALRANNG